MRGVEQAVEAFPQQMMSWSWSLFKN